MNKLSSQLLVHSRCRPASVTHSKDNRGTSADNVAPGIDGGDGRLHLFVHGNSTFTT